ncbi:tubulin-specific chaperone D isoform X2 [Adelges cooleyi]|uniref:tubulin-specific chaperone D isoform X2 n=1 Tax=Adelges cooleyi TaxID=133065 RepID=UPI00217F4A7A|nr:tubulin-specific chaperone D isoform X2 [Adelges cooleyi]
MVMPCDSVSDSLEDTSEGVGLGCCLVLFSEWKQVLGLIDQLPEIYSNESQSEKAYETLKYILTQYIEQPHLIDPYLCEILDKILAIVRDDSKPTLLKHKTFQYLFLVVSVRGYKVILRNLPHEVSDLEKVLKMLEEQDESDYNSWETRYCLLLWLSIIVIIPFDMRKLDGTLHPENKTTLQRLVDIIMKYLCSGDACRDTATVLATRLFIRSDVKETHLPDFLKWAKQKITDQNATRWERLGAMSTIAAIFKAARREDAQHYVEDIFECLKQSKCKSDNLRLTRKYYMKIVQRAGLTLLKVRIAAWRYDRGTRSLEQNLLNAESKSSEVIIKQNLDDVEDDYDDIPAVLEDIIQELIEGLKDTDIIVRYSAAKGIGRITGRLSKTYGNEVVNAVLSMLSPDENDNAWHGGCLALAELGRRGLLISENLSHVVPAILKALVYDEPKGYTSVGSHIRDAACYVCWSFARAFSTSDIQPYVEEIAGALLAVACFDRELTCRRAASAAFQENVGRQGTFPHGIDIVTAADYFAVGMRNHAYLEISVYIAQYKEYDELLIKHLLEKKIVHWDTSIRELAAMALGRLVTLKPTKAKDYVFSELLKLTETSNINKRHGSVMAVGEVLDGISKTLDPNVELNKELLEKIINLVLNLKNHGKLKGISSELVKMACCHLIKLISISKIIVDDKKIIDEWRILLEDCISNEMLDLRNKAVQAIGPLFSNYYDPTSPETDSIINTYVNKLSSNHMMERIGYSLALGSLPSSILNKHILLILNGLIDCAKITRPTIKWAESRRDAVMAITKIWTELSSTPCYVDNCVEHSNLILHCLLSCALEYTMDHRGDIGVWVREAAINSLEVIVSNLTDIHPELLDKNIVRQIMCVLVRQGVDRIDKIRGLSCMVITNLLHRRKKNVVPNVAHREELEKLFKKKDSFNWFTESDSFSVMVKFLSMPEYKYSVLVGLLVCIGGVSESLVKEACHHFTEHMKFVPDDEFEMLCNDIIAVWSGKVAEVDADERIHQCVLMSIERLATAGAFKNQFERDESEFAANVLTLIKKEAVSTKGSSKLTSCVELLCHLVQVPGQVGMRSMTQLSIFLAHRFAWLRKVVAARLVEVLIVYSDIFGVPDENVNEATELLEEFDWQESSVDKKSRKMNFFNITLFLILYATSILAGSVVGPAGNPIPKTIVHTGRSKSLLPVP